MEGLHRAGQACRQLAPDVPLQLQEQRVALPPVAHALEGVHEVAEHGGVVGAQHERLAVGGDGLLLLRGVLEGVAQVGERLRAVRLQPRHVLVARARLIRPPLQLEDGGEVVVGDGDGVDEQVRGGGGGGALGVLRGGGGVQLKAGQVAVHRLLVPSRLPQRVAQVVARLRERGLPPQRLLVAGDGLRDVPELEVQPSQRRVRARVRGVQRQHRLVAGGSLMLAPLLLEGGREGTIQLRAAWGLRQCLLVAQHCPRVVAHADVERGEPGPSRRAVGPHRQRLCVEPVSRDGVFHLHATSRHPKVHIHPVHAAHVLLHPQRHLVVIHGERCTPRLEQCVGEHDAGFRLGLGLRRRLGRLRRL
mmetsp:Transcript_28174/g.61736  ORF Transcript_28174/g.61736 Transcript_28174/m.61736 type:complete len:361 (-) Transcript_28174:1283-2365(-)